ncbi:MAG TPA: hypothetical protein ENK82_08585, partial [Campylobacterales bacterium]|nr:hypothetical protein [Campylobacterales bacterium]
MKFLKYPLFCVLFLQLIYANDVAYSFHLSKNNPYEKEAVLLEVNITQVDPSSVMLFNFSPKESDDYLFYQVDFKENEKFHDLRQQYYYILYPKKSGEVLIEFEMTKSITDDDKVAYSISGDRDNVKGLQKEDYRVELEPLKMQVKKVPLDVDLVGDFTLTQHLDKQKTKTYDPVNLKVLLKGRGFLAPFELIEESKEYTLFHQRPKFTQFHTKVGTSSSLEWDYAISATKDFSLAKRVLKGFDPKREKRYELVFPRFNIEVEEIEAEKLLDKKDVPSKSKEIDWSYFFTFVSYLIVFFAGWLMPKEILHFQKNKKLTFEESLKQKIKR